MKVRELLKGCKPGKMQTVGNMQVIPLISDIEDDRFDTPDSLTVGTSGYGSLQVNNVGAKPVILPMGTTYLVEQKAQNHALPGVGYVKAGKAKLFDTAACVQQSQGGYISQGRYEFKLLPLSLKESAYKVRSQRSYNKLWPAIAQFNAKAKLTASGHLELFFDRFGKELENFVAEFEPVPKQVGAIVLIDGKVVGVERMPSQAFFQGVWRQLIRDCYGSFAILAAKENSNPPKTRVPLPLGKIKSLKDLKYQLEKTSEKELDKAKDICDNILDSEVKEETVENADAGDDLTIHSLSTTGMMGQSIKDGSKVVYTSLVLTEAWAKHQEWEKAQNFSL